MKKRRHIVGPDPMNPWVLRQAEAQIKRDMARLQHDADWQAWMKDDNSADLVVAASRVLWITDAAVQASRLPLDSPDMRIIAGAANALGELANHPGRLATHRAAIQSGILAAQRLWEQVDTFTLGYAALAFDKTVISSGIGTQDFNCIRAIQK